MDKCNWLNFGSDEGSHEDNLRLLKDFVLNYCVLKNEKKDDDEIELFSPEKTAKILQISKNSLIRLRQSGEIGYRKCLRKILYSKKDIIEYVNSCHRRDTPKEKIENELGKFDYKELKKEKNARKKT